MVEAGLGGRHDATNVLRSRVVLLTNVGLEHTDVLGDTVAAIAREKLAVVHDENTIVVLPDDTFASLVPAGRIVSGGAREAAEAFAGHPIAADPSVHLPGRLEQRPGEVRDGAHNPVPRSSAPAETRSCITCRSPNTSSCSTGWRGRRTTFG